MIISWELDNGVTDSLIIDEKLIGQSFVPLDYIMGQIRRPLRQTLDLIDAKRPSDGSEHPHHGGRGEQQWER